MAPMNSDGISTVVFTIGSKTLSTLPEGNSEGLVTTISLPSSMITR